MESVEDIQARHRRELRDLQGRMTNKKKNATKKTRKGVNDECAEMERALKEKQAAELQAAAGGGDEEEEEEEESDAEERVDEVTAQLAAATVGEAAQPPPEAPKKRNRQKERLARRAAEQQRSAEQAAAEAATMVDHAAVERAALAPLVARSGRVEHLIRPDGHCLFSAVADQLQQAGRPVASVASSEGEKEEKTETYRIVRRVAADYMTAHADDFAPFLADEDTSSSDDAASTLAAHVAAIRDTAAWGGQLELQALARAYGVAITVLHDGRSEVVHPGDVSHDSLPMLWLVYYRHGFGLGEHYNSLRAPASA